MAGSGHPLQVVNIVAATAGYWNNLSTTAMSGAAPVSPEAFNDRFAGNTIEYRSEGDFVSLAVQSDNKFTESETSDGATDESPGGYAYEALGPETGRLALTHDDGDVCVANLFFASRESGWLVSECTGTDYPDDGYWLGGSWVLVETENSEPSLPGGSETDDENTVPSFPSGSEIEDQEYRAGTAIETLTLPEATGGDGTLTYSLEPPINGLTFDATTRQLSGTPMARSQTFEMTYTVTDEDVDTDTLAFDITIQSNRG